MPSLSYGTREGYSEPIALGYRSSPLSTKIDFDMYAEEDVISNTSNDVLLFDENSPLFEDRQDIDNTAGGTSC